MAIASKKRSGKRFPVFGATISAEKRASLVRIVRNETNGKRVKTLRRSDTASGSGHVRFAFPEITKKVQRSTSSGKYAKRVVSR